MFFCSIQNEKLHIIYDKDRKGENFMKVFLGGTCSGYDWRNDLIPKLVCDFYNPIVRDLNQIV